MPNKIWKGIAVFCTVLVGFLCLYQFESLPKVTLSSPDKYVHVAMHFALYFCWWNARAYSNFKSDIRLMIYVINYGILLEVLQEFCTQTRGYDPYDVVANVSGAFLAWILVYLYRRLRNKTQ